MGFTYAEGIYNAQIAEIEIIEKRLKAAGVVYDNSVTNYLENTIVAITYIKPDRIARLIKRFIV